MESSYYLIIIDNGDASVGIQPVSFKVECPFLKSDVDDGIKEDFKVSILNVYKEYSEGRIQAFYEDEEC